MDIYFAVYNLPIKLVHFLNSYQLNTFFTLNVKHVLPVEIFRMTIIQNIKIQNNTVTTFLHQTGHGSGLNDLPNISRKEGPVKAPWTVGKPSHTVLIPTFTELIPLSLERILSPTILRPFKFIHFFGE